MAYTSNLHNPYPSLGWDLHNIGVFNADMSLVMGTTTAAPVFSAPEDLSTGYLQDALVEFTDRSKRQRLQSYGYDQARGSDNHLEDYWNLNCTQDPSENFNFLNHIANFNRFSDEPLNSSMSSISDGATVFSEIKTPADTALGTLNSSSSSNSSYKDSVKAKCIHDKDTDTLISRDLTSISDGHCRKRKKLITGVVYPFELVKPGGIEGDVTLNDINERILMPPTRAVRHPVGDFACRPCVSADGLGLSGKAVVALTRIHTQGRGTITIIRTSG